MLTHTACSESLHLCVAVNGLCKRRPRVLGRYGGPRFYGIKFIKNVIQTGPPGRTNPFPARGLRLHNVVGRIQLIRCNTDGHIEHHVHCLPILPAWNPLRA